MYRLSISLWPDKRRSGVKFARIRHKRTGEQKIARVSDWALNCATDRLNAEMTYLISRRCKELHRNLLFRDFGGLWRKHEDHHKRALIKSLQSAAKRARNICG